MMDELRVSVMALMIEELERSRVQYERKFDDAEFALTVTKEEYFEAMEEAHTLGSVMASIERDVLCTQAEPAPPRGADVKELRRNAIRLACEAIQLAAMAQKWLDSPGMIAKVDAEDK